MTTSAEGVNCVIKRDWPNNLGYVFKDNSFNKSIIKARVTENVKTQYMYQYKQVYNPYSLVK